MAGPFAADRQDMRPWLGQQCRRHGECVALTRLRMDELVNAWVADRCTPFQIALLGVFDAAPFLLSDGALDVPRIRRELVVRARRVEAFRRRVVWTRVGEGMPVWAPDPSFDPSQHVEAITLPAGPAAPTVRALPVHTSPPLPSHFELFRDRLRGLATALRRARPLSGVW